MKKIQEAEIKNKNVLVRIDTDVPMVEAWTDGNTREIVDDERIKASIPTIKFLLKQEAAKIYIIGHLGRPDGKVDFNLSLWPVANKIAENLGYKAQFTKPEQCYSLDEKVVIFDNLRFNPGEEKNDPEPLQR